VNCGGRTIEIVVVAASQSIQPTYCFDVDFGALMLKERRVELDWNLAIGSIEHWRCHSRKAQTCFECGWMNWGKRRRDCGENDYLGECG